VSTRRARVAGIYTYVTGSTGEKAVRVEVYKTPWCGYCVRAAALLERKGIPFEEIDVAGDAERRAWLVETTGRRTVPQIFIDGEPIGGYTDLAALERSGELDRLLRRAA
jgi:glutaredoxin 3